MPDLCDEGFDFGADGQCCGDTVLNTLFEVPCCEGFDYCNAAAAYVRDCANVGLNGAIYQAWCPNYDLCRFDNFDNDWTGLPCPSECELGHDGLEDGACCGDTTYDEELECCTGYDYCANGGVSECFGDANWCPGFDYCAEGRDKSADGDCCEPFTVTYSLTEKCVGYDYCGNNYETDEFDNACATFDICLN